MNYSKPILEGTLLRRYKRFLADVVIDGEQMTVHCPNSGSMAGLLTEGNHVRISGPHSPSRKYLFTLEQIEASRPDGHAVWAGVNTALPNLITSEAIENGMIPELAGYSTLRSEVKLGENSRIDLLLEHKDRPRCWVEVKNVTLVQADPADRESLNVGDIATFPDAVTSRGARHLAELMECVRRGERAVMLYTVQRGDASRFAIASGFDPHYASQFASALDVGVEAVALLAEVRPEGVTLTARKLPLI